MYITTWPRYLYVWCRRIGEISKDKSCIISIWQNNKSKVVTYFTQPQANYNLIKWLFTENYEITELVGISYVDMTKRYNELSVSYIHIYVIYKMINGENSASFSTFIIIKDYHTAKARKSTCIMHVYPVFLCPSRTSFLTLYIQDQAIQKEDLFPEFLLVVLHSFEFHSLAFSLVNNA